MALAAFQQKPQPRKLGEDERLSLIGTLLLGWQIAIEENGEDAFDDNLYSFVPSFIAIAKSATTYWCQNKELTYAIPDDNEGIIQRRIPPFPTLSFPMHEDILIDGAFLDCMTRTLPDLCANPQSILSTEEVSFYYLPTSKHFASLMEQSFAAFCLGFEMMQPHKGRIRIIRHSDGKNSEGMMSGGRNYKVKWRLPRNRTVNP